MIRFRAFPAICWRVTWLCAASCSAAALAQQVRVVDSIPALYSNEMHSDSQPFLAVDPANTSHMVLTAFTPCPPLISTNSAPFYYSLDGGNTWQLNCVLPGNDSTYGTHGATASFATTGGVLYVGDMRGDEWFKLNFLRTSDFTSTAPMTVLVSRGLEDQPYTQAMTAAGTDHVYFGNNNLAGSTLFGGTTGKTSSVDWSTDAATALPPAGFATQALEVRSTCGQDLPKVRPALHASGKVYLAYLRNEPGSGCFAAGTTNTADVVVACDNNWGSGGYQDCQDPGDGQAGVLAVTGRTMAWYGSLGKNSITDTLSLAVDPSDSKRLYLAWGDGADPSLFTLHVRKSTDGGLHWETTDSRTIVSATNPALAIASDGKVGFLYQKLVSPGTCQTGGAPASCWETHFEIDDGTRWTDLPHPLANVPDTAGNFPLGNYNHVLAVGKNFYGAFSANNYPDTSNFYPGALYQRFVDWGTHQLYADSGHTTTVAPSVDPFFFEVAFDCDPCAPGLTCCNLQCVNLANSPDNCGKCGTACAANFVCSSSTCVPCGPGKTACSGTCVDLLNDPSNCGACGRQCELGCLRGVCRQSSCGKCPTGQICCPGADHQLGCRPLGSCQ